VKGLDKMRHAWIIDTHGKPLEAVNKLFADLWQCLNISHMLLPLKKPGGSQWTTEEISNKAQLKRSNPFTPLMTENIAQKIPEFQKAHPGEKLAALLRPCEISALKRIDEITQLTSSFGEQNAKGLLILWQMRMLNSQGRGGFCNTATDLPVSCAKIRSQPRLTSTSISPVCRCATISCYLLIMG